MATALVSCASSLGSF